MTESIIKKFEAKGFTRWTKYDMDRLYIDAETLGHADTGSKIWIDVETGKLCSKNADSELLADAQALADQVIAEIKEDYEKATKEEKAKKIVTYLRETFDNKSDNEAVKIVKYINETFGGRTYDNLLSYYDEVNFDAGYRALCYLAGTLDDYEAAEGFDSTIIACRAAAALGAIGEDELI